jgi:hypothetical protein
MNIDKIDPTMYADFIVKKFKEHGIRIDLHEVMPILSWAFGNTYNTQLLCNRVFSKSERVAKLEIVQQAISEIYYENKLSYFTLRNSMQNFNGES